MNEPKLTAPQRRYEIMSDPEDVHQSLVSSFGKDTPAEFEVELADIYEGPYIPDEILKRSVGMYVLSLSCSRRTGDVRASGYTVDNSAETVSVVIPKDREKKSTLHLLDISSTIDKE